MSKFDNDVAKAIYEMEQKGVLTRNIVLFGAGNNSRKLYEELIYRGYSIYKVIDNNEKVINKFFENIKIERAIDFLKKKEEVVFLILSNFYFEIKKQMEQYGYIENVDFFPVVRIRSNIENEFNENFENDLLDLYRGKKIYEMLQATYGKDKTFLINPASSIGDIYLMSFYSNIYLNRNKDIVFLFASQNLKKIAEELEMNEVIYMTFQGIQDLIKFAQVFGFEKINIKLLHTGYVHFRLWSRMLTLLKFTWMEHYRELFELSEDVKIDVKRLKWNEDVVNNLFKKYKLQEGNTIILSPYANTMQQFPIIFWDKLAQALQNKGYCVCTNVGSESEIAIKNTVPVFIPINEFVEFVNRAGYFIGIRSGLCDFLYGCEAKKVILYSTEVFDLIKVYDFYSLKKMGDKGSLKEIVYDKECVSYENIILEYLDIR